MVPERVKVAEPVLMIEPVPENTAPDCMYESEELVTDKLPPFKESDDPISIDPPFKVKLSALEELDMVELISMVPPVNVNVALEPDVLEIAAFTVSVLDEELPVVTETLTPELSEELMDEAKIVVVVDGVNVAE